MPFAPLLVYVFVNYITPGPNNIMSMYLGANYGLKGAKKFVIGSTCFHFAKIFLCGGLNVALAAVVPGLIPYLKWIGAAYMLYLAANMIISGFRKGAKAAEAKGDGSTYKSGVLLQLLNIKSWVSCLSVFSIYVIPYTAAFGDIFKVALITQAFMTASTLIWILFGNAIRRLYSNHIRLFSVIMAALLVWCAATALI